MCQGITGRSSAARLSRKREHARKCVGRSEARGGLRSTCKLPSCSQGGLPGAHVLAVVPAHRGTYAEVRGRCWLQISSRNALQKQRQTRVNGSLGDSLFRDFLGARVIEEASRLHVVAAKGHNHGGKAQGGVMSATRRFGLSREDRVACLARCGFGRPRMSGTGTSEGSSRMEVALGYGLRPSSRMGRKK